MAAPARFIKPKRGEFPPEEFEILRQKVKMEQLPENLSETKRLAPSPPPPGGIHHQRDVDDDDENVNQLDECSSLYRLMQDCVVRSNRNWKVCQPEVHALRECFEKRKNMQGK
ncbi:cytochrome c oxidase assembly factor 4 homolog, mitochondrial [Vigna unguiculata]|uniref:cytochrome c oxidase assembly factor 4 homolog, mitochondrial n=1 Tax=Vigna unguiculata TaxID=3917 RepID=UPI001016B5EC|nr:cytochrome c oxidase assembly factor 4 homolog, mitochondrial [Vigna unguiculata]